LDNLAWRWGVQSARFWEDGCLPEACFGIILLLFGELICVLRFFILNFLKQRTVFSFQALVLVFLFGYSFLLPTSLDKPFKEPEEIELEQVVTSQHLLSTSLDKEPEKSLNKS
jgi:hypothetical protein